MNESIGARRTLFIRAMQVLIAISVGLTCALVLFLIIYVLFRGLII